jgi:hypothetical protein
LARSETLIGFALVSGKKRMSNSSRAPIEGWGGRAMPAQELQHGVHEFGGQKSFDLCLSLSADVSIVHPLTVRWNRSHCAAQ